MSSGRSWLQVFSYNVSRIVVRWIAWLLFRLKPKGIDRFPEQGGALVCSNHQSYFDPVLLGAACKRRMNYLAREDLFDAKLLGPLIRWYDAIPVKREGMSISGLKETLRRLKRGELVLIFPEGTRSDDGEVAPLKSGFCMLARKAKVPLVPVALDGAFDVWPKDRKFPRLSRVCLQVGDPISAKQVCELSDEDLIELLSQRIDQCFTYARRRRLGKPARTEVIT